MVLESCYHCKCNLNISKTKAQFLPKDVEAFFVKIEEKLYPKDRKEITLPRTSKEKDKIRNLIKRSALIHDNRVGKCVCKSLFTTCRIQRDQKINMLLFWKVPSFGFYEKNGEREKKFKCYFSFHFGDHKESEK